MEQKIVGIVVRLKKLRGMLACFPSHCYKLKGNDVRLSGVDRGEVIRQTEVLAASLLDRLARESKSKPLRPLVVLINDQIVSIGRTREITVNELCFKQLFPNRLCLDLGEFRIDGFLKDLLVLFRCFAALLILPLPLKKGCLVYESKNFIQVSDLNNFGTVERGLRSIAGWGNIRSRRVCRVA